MTHEVFFYRFVEPPNTLHSMFLFRKKSIRVKSELMMLMLISFKGLILTKIHFKRFARFYRKKRRKKIINAIIKGTYQLNGSFN